MTSTRRTLFRQWLMLQLLPRAPQRTTATEIAERLEAQGHSISKRSIERDLQALSGAFPIECDDRSKPFGWSWLRNAPSFTLPGMSPLQALVLKTAELHLKGLLPASQVAELNPLFRQANQTLGTKPGRDGLAAWPRSIVVVPATLPLIPPPIDGDVLRTIHQALIDQRQVRITYQARAARQTKAYAIHPIGLIQRGSNTYLACTFGDFDDPRMLAMHRIRSAEATDAAAKRQPSDVLESAKMMVMSGFTQRGEITLVMRMASEVVAHLEESRLSEDQTITVTKDADWMLVTATVNDTEQLRWWLAGYAEYIEVLKPKKLRSSLAKSLAEAAGLYQAIRAHGPRQ
jgi:predicted DNA-binding transcriptional regulator YafY